MKLPICEVCNRRFNPFFPFPNDGVIFALTIEEIDRKLEMERYEKLGHPVVGYVPGFHWFCRWHKRIAKKYRHLTWEKAESKIYIRLIIKRVKWFIIISIIVFLYFGGYLK